MQFEKVFISVTIFTFKKQWFPPSKKKKNTEKTYYTTLQKELRYQLAGNMGKKP